MRASLPAIGLAIVALVASSVMALRPPQSGLVVAWFQGRHAVGAALAAGVVVVRPALLGGVLVALDQGDLSRLREAGAFVLNAGGLAGCRDGGI